MAVFTWEVYSDTPAWHDIAANTIVFTGSGTEHDVPITVAAWQEGTHLGSGDPGTHQCGTAHVPNVKYISSTEYDSGGGTEDLLDANLVETECSFRVEFADAASVATSSGRFYSYDGSTVTVEAIGVEVYAFERGVGASAWTFINDDSTNHGGDNSGERLPLTDQSAATEHTFFFAVSASPESVGAKTEFDFGIALTYS